MYVNPIEDFNRLDNAMRGAGMAWWEMELPSGVVFFGDNKATMIGYPASDFVHYKNFTDLLHPDDEPKAMKAMMDHLEGKTEHYETTYRIRHKKGHYVTFYDRGQIVQKLPDGEVRVSGIVMNLNDVHIPEAVA